LEKKTIAAAQGCIIFENNWGREEKKERKERGEKKKGIEKNFF